jgi:hypothetical protein
MATRRPTEEARSGEDQDSLVGVPSHPLAAAVGALVAGGATGAVVGTAAGPVGTAIGAVVGAVVGALGGDAVASSVGQATDEAHWRREFARRPYVKPGSSYDDYGPAYALGEDLRRRRPEAQFDALDAQLDIEWITIRSGSRLEWGEARPAAREAWERYGAQPNGDLPPR